MIAAAPLIVSLSSILTGLTGIGNTLADAAVAIGVLGELRFGNVAGAVLKIKLADAVERAANAENKSATALGLGGAALGAADEARAAADSIDDCGMAMGMAAKALREVAELRAMNNSPKASNE